MKNFLAALFSLLCACAWAQGPAPGPTQDLERLRSQLAQFLNAELSASNTLRITVPAIHASSTLANCPEPIFNLPGQAAALRGTIRIDVRCSAPQVWRLYANASVHEIKTYYVASQALTAGHKLGPDDLSARQAATPELPAGASVDLQQLLGRTLTLAVPAGSVLKNQQTRAVALVKAGQNVTLVASGPGFKISAEGRALGSAQSGQTVQVRTASGQVLSGSALREGVVALGQ